MNIGIIGLPNSGKTTLFNALSSSNVEVTSYAKTDGEINVAVLSVYDNRIEKLSNIFKPQKTTYAQIECLDLPGLPKGSVAEGKKITEFLAKAREVDALIHIIRAFKDGSVPHPAGSIDPIRDEDDLSSEILLSDLMIVEKRIERIEKEMKKGENRQLLQKEKEVMERFKKALEAGVPIREVEISDDEEKMIRGYRFLTQKPQVIVLNVEEDEIGKKGKKEFEEKLLKKYSGKNLCVVETSAKIEMELTSMSEEDASIFLDELNIDEPARDKIINACYSLLGLISFITVGEDEVRAWTIPAGTKAVDAAGAIHSDISRGFIKAEVISYDDFIEAGSIAEARRKGLFRLEGKNYIVQDGDIMNFKFNV